MLKCLGLAACVVALAGHDAGEVAAAGVPGDGGSFAGRFYCGQGDVEYLQLLDIAGRMFAPDPEFQNIAMLYTPVYNGFEEGPTWGAGWWVQNTYGASYCALPFLREPLRTFLQNSQDLWFDQMGDGKTVRTNQFTPPDGCLCDCAAPGWFVARQGDGDTNGNVYDWALEFTAAGMVMQGELLLVDRDAKAIEHYLPKLRRVPISSKPAAIRRTTSFWSEWRATCTVPTTQVGRSPTEPLPRPI